MIHSSAQIDPTAEIDEDVSVGPHTVIGPNVKILKGTVVEGNAYIHKNTILGKENLIYPFKNVIYLRFINKFKFVFLTIETALNTIP